MKPSSPKEFFPRPGALCGLLARFLLQNCEIAATPDWESVLLRITCEKVVFCRCMAQLPGPNGISGRPPAVKLLRLRRWSAGDGFQRRLGPSQRQHRRGESRLESGPPFSNQFRGCERAVAGPALSGLNEYPAIRQLLLECGRVAHGQWRLLCSF